MLTNRTFELQITSPIGGVTDSQTLRYGTRCYR